MYCDLIDTVYLKANGELPCACSPGEHFPLYELSGDNAKGIHFADAILNSPDMRGYRLEIHDGRRPFGYCADCALFVKARPGCGLFDYGFDPSNGRLHTIRNLQLEASYLCNLDCPYCVPIRERKRLKQPPYFMPLSLVRKITSDLASSGIPVLHCALSGRGEPLMHPELPGLVRILKQGLGCTVSVHTNGNFELDPALLAAGVDHIAVAVDGTNQADYTRYRRGGKLDKALRFMKDLVSHRNCRKGDLRIVWQYILFNWNTSEAHLRELFKAAEAIGVDGLFFVQTDTPSGEKFCSESVFRKEMLALIDEFDQAQPALAVDRAFHMTAFHNRPPVRMELKLRHVEDGDTGEEPFLEGRIKNLRLEPLHITIRVVCMSDDPPRELLMIEKAATLPSRGALVDGVPLSHDALAGGYDRVSVELRDSKSGEILLEGRIRL